MKNSMSKLTLTQRAMTLLCLVLFGSFPAPAQNLPEGAEDQKRISSQTWNTLSKVDFKMQESAYGEMYLPEFSSEVKNLEGKEITLPGYMVPADGLKGVFKPTHFILSSLPLAACFFCGVGGPESVVEVYMSEPIEYTTEAVKIKGKLMLNGVDSYQMMYILEDAEFMGISE